MSSPLIPLVSGRGRPYLRYSTQSGAQWLLPTERNLRYAAIEMYKPHRVAGVLRKQIMRRGLLAERVGISNAWLGWLEQWVQDHLGDRALHLAFYVSSPGALSKVAALVLDHNAHSVAFMKLASTGLAVEALEREHGTLEHLKTALSLRNQVPVPLHWSPQTDRGAILITNAAPPSRGPRHFHGAHREFLDALRGSSSASVALSQTSEWRRAQRCEEVLEGAVTRARWYQRCHRAMTMLTDGIGDTAVSTSRAHGDFAPWNTRLSNKRLFVFDWESSDDRHFTNYDYYHFQFMTSLLLRGRIEPADLRSWQRHAPACEEPQSLHALAFILDLSLRYHRLHRYEGRAEDDHLLRATGGLLDNVQEWLT